MPVPDAKRIALLVADLDSTEFRTRDAATRALEKLGPLATPALEKRLTEKPGLETQNRIDLILAHAERTVLTIEQLRAVRAIEIDGPLEPQKQPWCSRSLPAEPRALSRRPVRSRHWRT